MQLYALKISMLLYFLQALLLLLKSKPILPSQTVFFRFRRSVNAVFFLAAKDGAVDSIAVHAKMAKVSTKNGSQRKILFFILKTPHFISCYGKL